MEKIPINNKVDCSAPTLNKKNPIINAMSHECGKTKISSYDLPSEGHIYGKPP